MDTKRKTDVLKVVAHAFNQAGITWSLGGSMLLYFKGITTEFSDIDIMVMTEEIELVKSVMALLKGELQPPNPNAQYKTKVFLEYVISEVDVDLMAGFRILNDGILYDCSLEPSQIVEWIDLDGEKIPLQSVELWCQYYELMGRDHKVQRIKKALLSNC